MLALRQGRYHQASLAQGVEVIDIGLIAMTVALGHHITIDFVGQRAFGNIGALRTQAHGAAQVRICIAYFDAAVFVFPFGDQGDHRFGSAGVELGAVGIVESGHVTRKFDGGDLHAQTDAQIGHLVLTGKAGRAYFAFHTADAKAARHQNRIEFGQLRHVAGGDGFRVDIVNLDARVVFHAGVPQCFVQRFVAVAQFHIFANHDNVDIAFRVGGFIDKIIPALETGRWRIQAQLVTDQAIQTLFMQHARHLVDGVHVPHGNHTPQRHVGEQGNLLPFFLGNGAVSTAQQGIGLDADFTQLLGGVLCRFGFQLAGCGNPGHITQMHKSAVVGAELQTELAHRLQKGQ